MSPPPLLVTLPPLRCSSCFAPLVRVWTRRFLFLSLLVFSHRFLAMSFPLPSGPRSSCCIDHGYSAIVFNLPCSCCGCRLQENFACLSLLRTLLEFLSFSLSFPFSRLFSSLFIPFFPLLPGTPGWHLFLEPSHLPPDFCVSSHPLHFLSFSKWTSEFMRRN